LETGKNQAAAGKSPRKEGRKEGGRDPPRSNPRDLSTSRGTKPEKPPDIIKKIRPQLKLVEAPKT